jgi:CP family cyanate transporter-like MFS transporter
MWTALALLALAPWVTMVVRNRAVQRESPALDEADAAILGRLWKSPIAWAIAGVFAASSLNAYAMFAWLPSLLVDTAGVSPAHAGTLLAVYAGMGIPCALIIPVLTARMTNIGPLVYVGVGVFVAGDLGLLFAAETLTWLWVSLAGLGPLFFPLALVLINLRTRTHAGAVALSSFVQSIGYTLGALGPLVVGLLHEFSGGWSWPLIFLLATALAIIIAVAVIGRPHMLEDDLERLR